MTSEEPERTCAGCGMRLRVDQAGQKYCGNPCYLWHRRYLGLERRMGKAIERMEEKLAGAKEALAGKAAERRSELLELERKLSKARRAEARTGGELKELREKLPRKPGKRPPLHPTPNRCMNCNRSLKRDGRGMFWCASKPCEAEWRARKRLWEWREACA